jgi:hypothetical protein
MAEVAVLEKPRSATLSSINPSRMGLVEYLRQDWVVTAEPGTEIADLKRSDYWAHMAARMMVYDRVEVRAEDGSWIVELVVTDKGSNWAKTRILQEYALDANEIPQPLGSLHSIVWKGPHLKFCILRNNDSALVKQGMLKEEAIAALKDIEADIFK